MNALYIPINKAVICVTCDSISDEKGLRCPACGSLGLMNLANVLGTMNDERPATFSLERNNGDFCL